MKTPVLLLVLACSLPAHAAAAPARPNIIFLLADDQRYDTLGVTGNKIVKTPNIDRLAAGGALFERDYVVSSACSPNRAAILSGMYNRSMGVRDFSADFPPQVARNLYPFVLKRAGYHIGFIGKWGVASTIESTIEPYAKQFDYWRGFVGQGDYYTKERKDRHLEQIIADQAEEFLKTAPRDRPFNLSISFKAPHGPWSGYDRRFRNEFKNVDIPFPATLNEESVARLPPFMRTFRLSLNGKTVEDLRGIHQEYVRQYYRLIMGLDEAVGRIVAALEREGLAGNTVIIYASDNGHFLHEWGFHGKWLMYEPSIHVPLVIHDPRLPAARRGARVKALTQSVDYAPTMIELAGAEIPDNIQGRSLVPLLRGDAPAGWRDDVFHDYDFEMYPGDIPKNIGVRTERHKLVRYITPRPQYEQLFDLEKDPLELENLIDNPALAGVRSDLQRRLAGYRTKLKDAAPDYEEYAGSYQVTGIGADFPDEEADFSGLASIGQTFRAATSQLRHVEWRWPYFIMRHPQNGVEVLLKRGGPDGEVIANTVIPPREIYNLNLSRARFDAKDLKVGETLYVEFRPQGKPAKRRVGMWKYGKDSHADGTAWRDGKPVDGDIPLYFVFVK